jgi:hypothetical protein
MVCTFNLSSQTSSFFFNPFADGPLPVNLLHWNTVTALNNEDCRLIYGNQLKDNMVCVAGDYNNKTRTCSVS